MTNLEVPYVSQFDPQSNEDPADNCGPSCVSMILNFYGEKTTVNQIFELTGAIKGQPISIVQLQKAITALGYSSDWETGVTPDNLKAVTDKNIPPIALVHAGDLKSRQDQGFAGGHFIVIDGYRDDGYFANDPDFWGQYRQDGDHHFYTKAEFEQAWSDCTQDNNPNNGLLVIHPKVQPTTGLPANYPDIVHGSTQWDQSVAKYLPNSDPTHTDFPALQAVVAGIQSNATASNNAKEKALSDLVVANQEVTNFQEKLAVEEQQRQDDVKSYLAQINALKPNADATKKMIDTFTGQIGVLQGQVKQLINDKHALANQLAVCQQQNPQPGWLSSLFSAIANLFRKQSK